MIYSAFIKFFINFIALLITVYLFPGIRINNWKTCIFAAVVLTLINTFLKPIIMFFTLPLNILTLGLFTLIINGAMFYLVSAVIDGFSIDSYYHAFFGGIVFSIVSFFLNFVFRQDNETFKVRFKRYNFKDKDSRNKYRTVIEAETTEEKLHKIQDKTINTTDRPI